MSESKERDDYQDIAYLVVAVVVFAGVVQLWRGKVKPWLVDHNVLHAHGGVSTQDLVGVAVLVVPLIVLALLVRSWWKRKRRAAADHETTGMRGQ